MYLTKLKLTAENHAKYKIHDAYSIHKLVYSLFPIYPEQEKQRILYVDKDDQYGGRFLLIMSSSLPKGPETLAMTSRMISDSFFNHPQYQFETVLNPVKKNSSTGKREAVIGLLPVMKWLTERSPKWGFTVDETTLQAFIQNTVAFKKGDRQYCFNKVLFRGVLTVTDQNLFCASAMQGIGHAKAFGFGMLQLHPCNQI